MDEQNNNIEYNNAPQAQPIGQTPSADGSYRYIPPQQDPNYTQTVQGAVPPQGTIPPQGAQAYTQGSVPPEPPKRPKQKKHRGGLPTGAIIGICAAAIVIVAAATSLVTVSIVKAGSARDAGSVEAVTQQETAEAEAAQATPVPQLSASVSSDSNVNQAAAYVYNLATQQVVGITSDITYYNVFGQTTSASVSGSGVIVTDDGYILTNYHVIEDAYEGGYTINVMMYDESTYEAEIVGFDEESDIALLKIDAEGLNAATLGDSDNLQVGTVVYTVGNPLGELTYTMTSGIVSATNRAITTEADVAVDMFQIDAAVNSGNSGGPVYNSEGQVIGIVTAKYASTGVEGLGFAIPISDAMDIANQLLENGYVADRASMGISCTTVTEAVAEHYNMVVGAYVNEITSGSAAETAGLQVGDIITALDDNDVAGSSDLNALVRNYKAGDEATLTIWRDGKEKTLQITFDEKQPETEDITSSASGEMNGQNGQDGYSYYYSGDIDDFMRQFFGNSFGYGY